MRSAGEPRWVVPILASPLLWHAARFALVSAYLLGGVVKLFDFAAAVAEQERFGLHPGWLWATLAIVVELGGSLLVLADRLVWLGAGALGVLTFVAMLTANAFWSAPAADRWIKANAFFEHFGLIAGFVLLAMLSDQRRSTS
ncbi:DoxX family protein [Rhodopseudomonas palustris]|uniref:DoxX family protein n=1 Tax=Rhodopseudomonas palustris TaxID=1076 RepID=UPI0022F1125D|nr:DoxX family protein [Rhodopseudomonas palustris]WBU31939.1 DoxX family protein [Rhodopseudomonas palustris]